MQNKLKVVAIGRNIMKLRYARILPFTILLISVYSILQWCSIPIGNTFVWWCIQGIILFFSLKLKPCGYSIWQIKLYLIYLYISAIYGSIFMVENYWDWKLLIFNLLAYSLPLVAYVYFEPTLLIRTLRVWVKYAWIILLILMPFLWSDAYGRYLAPFTFIALFMPLLNLRYRIYVIVAYIITLVLGIDDRSSTIKFSVAIIFSCLFLLGKFRILFSGIVKFAFITLMIMPAIFFVLGITGIFNIFQIENELGLNGQFMKKNSLGEDVTALSDTRTFIYVEEISSAIKHNYVVQGRSIARGYESLAFGRSIDENYGVNRGERGGSEVSIMNIFNYMGIIGVFIYFLIFWGAAYKAVYKSNNIYMPILGLFVAFRWCYAWIHDPMVFHISTFILFVMVGMCYSPVYRGYTNKDFKELFIKPLIR